MTEITELKIEDEAQLIELLSENVIAPYMLLTEDCDGFMGIEVGYCNTQPVKIDGIDLAYVAGKVAIPLRVKMITILDEHSNSAVKPTNVNIDVTCNGYIRFFSRSSDKVLIWYEPLEPDVPARLIEIPRQEPKSEPIVIETPN